MERFLSKSTLMAAIVAIGIIVWMASGTITSPGSSAAESAPRAASLPDDGTEHGNTERAGIRVGIRSSQAGPVERLVSVSARTEPNRSVEIRGEAEGRVVAITAERGTRISAGQTIARLDLREREARLTQAQAELEQHRIQYRAALDLAEQGLMSEVQIAEARARQVSSEAALETIQLEIERTRITAPFDGVLQERPIEIGDLIRVGDTVAEVVDTDPIIVVGDVNEREIATLAAGRSGHAQLPDGRRIEGTVRYVAPVADPATRTFRVELAVPNPDLKLRAGVTAKLELATDQVHGHLLPASLLTLDDEGTIGVKIVDSNSRARFIPAEVLRSDAQGVWVAGLPESIDIISVGQGFVVDGQLVEGVAEDGSAARP